MRHSPAGGRGTWARAGDELAPTARLFLSYLVRPEGEVGDDRFQLADEARTTFVA